jgi:mitochondrial fission protein ELM1
MRSLAQIHENDNPPILILGGGFAGLFAALHLRDLHSCPKYPTLTLPDILGRELDLLFLPNISGGLRGVIDCSPK